MSVARRWRACRRRCWIVVANRWGRSLEPDGFGRKEFQTVERLLDGGIDVYYFRKPGEVIKKSGFSPFKGVDA